MQTILFFNDAELSRLIFLKRPQILQMQIFFQISDFLKEV